MDKLQQLATDSMEIMQIRDNPALQKQMLDNLTKNGKSGGPFRRNRPVIGRMIKDRFWYILGSPLLRRNRATCDKICRCYHVKPNTHDWYRRQLAKNPYFLPRNQGHADDQRVFSAKQKEEIADTLCDIANEGYPLTLGFIREIIMFFYNNLNPSQRHNPAITSFNYSRKFMSFSI